MRVAVDKAGNYYLARGIDYFARRVFAIDIRGISDFDDATVLDCHAAVFDYMSRAIHRHDSAAFDN